MDEQEDVDNLNAAIARRRWRPKEPKRIANVMSELMTRRGYAHQQTSQQLAEAWREAAGKLARHSRPGNVKRGVLEVAVRSSTVVQELTFQKKRILAKLTQLAPEHKISGLKFFVGAVE